MRLTEEENEERVAERDEAQREQITIGRSYTKIRSRRQRRTESRVSLSQSHKSLLSALIVATRQRAAKH